MPIDVEASLGFKQLWTIVIKQNTAGPKLRLGQRHILSNLGFYLLEFLPHDVTLFDRQFKDKECCTDCIK